MFLIYYGLWLIFNGRFTLEIALIGLPVVGAVWFFALRTLGLTPKKELSLLRRAPRLLGYLFFLLKEVILAALHVMKLIWRREPVRPRLIRFRPELESDIGKTALADSITLTPGTITVLLEDGTLTVHALDASAAEGTDSPDNPMTRRLRVLEKEGKER